MARPRSLLADYGVYLLVRLTVCFIQAVPFPAGRAIADLLAWLAYRFDRRHREVAAENLRRAFPGHEDEQALDRLVRQVYRHFCMLVIELAHLPRRVHVSNWRRYLELSDGAATVRPLLCGRPCLIVTGHLGNWEMAGFTLGLLGFRTYAVARPLDNPFLDRFLRRFRESTGQRVLAKKGDFEQMQAVLVGGGILATLGDQDAGARGLFVDFFGRPASTHKAIALLALEHRVPMLVTAAIKVGEPMQYRIVVGDLILPEEYDGRPDAVRAITQRFTTAFERLVRMAPAQYFWLHRRWKHEPKARRTAA